VNVVANRDLSGSVKQQCLVTPLENMTMLLAEAVESIRKCTLGRAKGAKGSQLGF
jgi:hypothetical protein